MGQVSASIIKSQCLLKNILFLTDLTKKTPTFESQILPESGCMQKKFKLGKNNLT